MFDEYFNSGWKREFTSEVGELIRYFLDKLCDQK